MVFLIFLASVVAIEGILGADRRRMARRNHGLGTVSQPTSSESLAALMTALAADGPGIAPSVGDPDPKIAPIAARQERYNIP